MDFNAYRYHQLANYRLMAEAETENALAMRHMSRPIARLHIQSARRYWHMHSEMLDKIAAAEEEAA